MSILCCNECGAFIDTDDDPGAYREPLDRWICEYCWHHSYICAFCDQPSVTTLDGDNLCKLHADQWLANEREAYHSTPIRRYEYKHEV